MIDPDALRADLKDQVRALERDLRERAESEFDATLRAEWRSALDAERTDAPYESGLKNSWLDDRVTQAAVAWVLGTVFVRFCEDNGLIELPYLAGRVGAEHGARLAVAKERQEEYWNTDEDPTDRGWIERSFDALAVTKVTAGLFDRAHNPMWTITPSHEAAKRLLAFWREMKETGEIRHDFTDPSWDTRFLGDLYEHLSTHAQETYALRQTPVFVEEFILRYTLTPALAEFGLTEKFRLIDPTCGSGHFLLSAFEQILTEWKRLDASASRWELIARSLNSVHGVDKNPFAAAIARFRLLIAALKAGEVSRLTDLRGDLAINVAIGDSLLHGSHGPQADEEIPGLFSSPRQAGGAHPEEFAYRTEDILDYVRSCDILAIGSYDVVVGNPPYIQVDDKKESANYRKAYTTCYRQYQLVVPFVERFFRLAKRAGGSNRNGGYVGQITGNGFMKREFGKKLVENYLSGADPQLSPQLTHIIDTSGAYLPSHGTPTVILIGRNQLPLSSSVIRTVMSIQGEPEQPKIAAEGRVWTAIDKLTDHPGSPSPWISVADSRRTEFLTHPWNLAGGGAVDLQARLVRHASTKLGDGVEIGTGAVTRENETYLVGEGTLRRGLIHADYQRSLVEGENVRDWVISGDVLSLWPYSPKTLEPISDSVIEKFLWPWRRQLGIRTAFGKTQLERGLPWTAYSMFFVKRFGGLTIAFAFVQTHNQFVLDRGDRAFNRSAPIIKLPEGASEDDHLGLLGILNSSAACFWLKQVSHDKGNRGGERSTGRYDWESFFEFTVTKLQDFPLPATLPLELGRELDTLANRLAALEPSAVCAEDVPTRERLAAARAEHDSLRRRMIALQEELDWEVYRLYGLLDEFEAAALIAQAAAAPVRAFDNEQIAVRIPELKLGERAFEILMARKGLDEAGTQWFRRHGSEPITDLPNHWPEVYKTIVEARIQAIERRRDLGLIERPECKRRWSAESWEKREREALRGWMLNRCEDRTLWFTPDGFGGEQPRTITVARLADRLGRDADFVAVARLYGGPDTRIADVVAEIIEAEHVPFLAQLRYKPSGLVKWARWGETWEKQREEDQTGQQLDIDVPERYTSADFLKTSYWRNRGKLDVPKERFISYPYASPETDGSLLLGWAGWNHLQRAQALFTLVEERRSGNGWGADELAPLLAGLAEVLPWVWQWHGERDAEGRIPAEGYAEYLQEQQRELQLTDDDLRGWGPSGPSKGRAFRE